MNNRIDFLRSLASIIHELERFSPSIIELGGKIKDNRLEMFEKAFDLELPLDFKMLMKRHNGFSLMGNTVYSVNDSEFSENLAVVYKREHTLVRLPQFDYLVPFSPDGGGNFYCFDTKTRTNDGYSSSVVFWVSNFDYTTDNPPGIVYNSFAEYVKEVIIEWTLEEFDYEGNEV